MVSSLHQLQRVRASNLSHGEFWRRFVLSGVPVVLELERPIAFDSRAVARECGGQVVDVVNKNLVLNLLRASWLQHASINLFLVPALGQRIWNWAEHRQHVTLGAFQRWVDASDAELQAKCGAATGGPCDGSLWIPRALRWLSPHSASAGQLLEFVRVILSPPYVSDMPLRFLCPEDATGLAAGAQAARAMEEGVNEAVGKWAVPTWLMDEFHSAGISTTDVILPDWLKGPFVFWGGIGAYAYPLHTDLANGDRPDGVDAHNLQVLLSGCKEVVLVREDELLSTTAARRPPNTNYFMLSAFDAPAPSASAHGPIGWHGRVAAGEILYFPGDLAHQVRVACANTVAVNFRPWRHTAVQTFKRLLASRGST